ncbi:MAG: hypothetical protein JW913_19285 [Chitinispirillaceae bacterium]|nr:hypothetical protein [Chitinispirillaceae bacterium]
MSKEEYDSLVPMLSAISPEEVRSPHIPSRDLVQEAEDLCHWSMDDRDALSAAGLAPEAIDQLMPAAGALRYAQSDWYKLRFAQAESQKQWSDESDKAYDLRNRLIHALLYALRNNPDALARVRGVAEGVDNADKIQDLSDLRALGLEYKEDLGKINFDLTLFDKAAEAADRLGELLGAANAETAIINEALDIRNRAFTHLRNLMTEVRECGKYVFYRNKKRLRGYTSEYVRRINRSNGKEETPEPAEEPVTA